MPEMWLSIKDIPAEGREFSFSDPAIWAEPCAEFGIACEVRTPLQAELQVLPQKDGYLLRGSLKGQVSLPCDRCAEAALVDVQHRFDEFEALAEPNEPQAGGRRGRKAEAPGLEEEDSSLLRHGQGGPELNVGALLWEQFLLTLPVKPLCGEECRGLCGRCGQNLNLGPCGCPEDEGDPRLAALRNIKLS